MKKWGLSTKSIAQILKHRKSEDEVSKPPKEKPDVKPSETKFTQPSYAELDSEVRYLRGWKECSIAFIEALKR